jgi:hypothetical protein
MLGFIYKEIKVNKQWLCIMFGLVIFFSCFPILTSIGEKNGGLEGTALYAVYFLINGTCFLVVGMMASMLIQTDERKKWGYYATSVHGGIKKQVGAIYLIILAAILFTLGLTCILNSILRKAVHMDIPDATGMMLVFALIVLFMRSIEMPFIYAFGSKIGSAVKALLVFILLFIAAVYFMFADLSWLGSMDDFLGNLLKWFSELDIKHLITGGFVGKLLLAAVPMYIASYFISTKVYLKGVERLEK